MTRCDSMFIAFCGITIKQRKRVALILGVYVLHPNIKERELAHRHFNILSVCSDWKQINLVTPADKERNVKGEKMMDGNVEVVSFYLKQ